MLFIFQLYLIPKIQKYIYLLQFQYKIQKDIYLIVFTYLPSIDCIIFFSLYYFYEMYESIEMLLESAQVKL